MVPLIDFLNLKSDRLIEDGQSGAVSDGEAGGECCCHSALLSSAGYLSLPLSAGVCLQDPAPPVRPRLQGCRLEPLLSGLDGEVEDHGDQQEGEAEAGGPELW